MAAVCGLFGFSALAIVALVVTMIGIVVALVLQEVHSITPILIAMLSGVLWLGLAGIHLVLALQLRKGRRWAAIVATVVLGIGLLAVVAALVVNPLPILVDLFILFWSLLAVAVVVLLWGPGSSRAYLRSAKRSPATAQPAPQPGYGPHYGPQQHGQHPPQQPYGP